MSSSRKRSIWLGPPLERLVQERGVENVSGAINTAVGRYLEVCRRHVPRLSVTEWCAVFDALNGVWLSEAWSPIYLWVEVDDTSGLGPKWEIDKAALVAKLQALTYAELVAVADATERFWATPNDRPSRPDDGRQYTLEETWRDLVESIVGHEAIVLSEGANGAD